MKLHTELFQLRQLLMEELAEYGCFPFRNLNSVEVDLTAGELTISMSESTSFFYSMLHGFCERNGLVVKYWNTEGSSYTLGLREPVQLADEVKPRLPVALPILDLTKIAKRKREYAEAVRQVFRSSPCSGVYLHTGRVAWSMARPDLAAYWFGYAAEDSSTDGVRLEALVWRGVCLHLEAGEMDRVVIGQACRCYLQALELDKDNFLAQINLGKLFLLLGWNKRSRRFLLSAALLRRTDREIPFLLSLLS